MLTVNVGMYKVCADYLIARQRMSQASSGEGFRFYRLYSISTNTSSVACMYFNAGQHWSFTSIFSFHGQILVISFRVFSFLAQVDTGDDAG